MNFLFETKYALRLLRKTPGFTAASILIASIGIAVSVVAFTFVYTLTYKPLKYGESDTWFTWFGVGSDSLVTNTDPYFFQRIQKIDFEHLTVIGGQVPGETSVLTDGDTSQRVTAFYQSTTLFENENLIPILGRRFNSSDTLNQNEPVVMISYDAWQQHYNANPEIVGEKIRLNQRFYTIIGVLPKGYNLGFSGDFWLPLDKENLTRPANRNLRSVVRLRNPNNRNLAIAELENVLDGLKNEFPDTYLENYQVVLTPLNQLGPGVGSINMLLIISSIIFVLFTCLNTGSLLFTHILERQRELNIRSAIGSNSWRLVNHALMESMVICLVSALFGLLSAHVILLKVDSILSIIISANSHFRLSLGIPALLFALAMMGVIWLLSGLLPAIRAIKLANKTSPSSQNQRTTNSYSAKTTNFLVGFQVMFTCFLLICSGILVVVMNYVSERDLGITTDSVLVSEVPMSERYATFQDKVEYLDQLAMEVSAISDINNVAFTTSMPSMQSNMATYQLEDRDFNKVSAPRDPLAYISEDYFSAIGVDFIEGRSFNAFDNDQSLLVAIVDISFQQRYWPNESALGKRINVSVNSDSLWVTIVGVTTHVLGSDRYRSDTNSIIYLPIRQHDFPDPNIVVRHSGNEKEIKDSIAMAAAQVDRELPLVDIDDIQKFYLMANAMAFVVTISRIFFYISIVTLILATTGIFAVLTRSIIQKTHDIGIQRALGASRSNVVLKIVRKGLFFLFIGGGIGVALGVLALSAIFNSGSIPYAPGSTVPTVIISVVISIAACVLLASYLPARAAVKKEPGDALRYE